MSPSLRSGTQTDFSPEQQRPNTAASPSPRQTSAGAGLRVGWAPTLPAKAGSTNHFAGGTSDANFYTRARHKCFLEWLTQHVYIHIPTGPRLWHIKAVSENICTNEMHHCCWRKIKRKSAQRLAEWGWLMTLMSVAADQEIKHRTVHHDPGR